MPNIGAVATNNPNTARADAAAARLLALAVFLVSVALLALQIVLLQVLAIVQGHHFAYLVISLALLGFGASGTALATAPARLTRSLAYPLPIALCLCALSIVWVIPAAHGALTAVDPHLIFLDRSQWLRLAVAGLIYFFPFFWGALALGLVFSLRAAGIGNYYAANLTGSGLGAAAGVGLLHIFSAGQITAVLAILCLLAALCAWGATRRERKPIKSGHRFWPPLFWLLFLAICLRGLWHPSEPGASQFKDLSRTLNLPAAEIIETRQHPAGKWQRVRSPALRHAPDVSLTHVGAAPVVDMVFINADGYGVVPRTAEDAAVLDATPQVLPYLLAGTPPQRVLILGAGGGMRVIQALQHGVGHITVVEPHAAAADNLANLLDDLDMDAATLAIRVEDPRAYLSRSPAAAYDLILLPEVGAFGGSPGLHALREQYLLTREGLQAVYRVLAPDGMAGVTVWLDYPPRSILRMTDLLHQTLISQGAREPLKHLLAWRGWGSATLVMARQPFDSGCLEQVRDRASQLRFDLTLAPDIAPDERMRYHKLADDALLRNLDALLGASRDDLLRAYPFNLRAPTDQRPYFSQFLKLSSLPRIAEVAGQGSLPFVELGSAVAALTLVLLIPAACLFILLPLTRLPMRGPGKGFCLLYFASIGAGFMTAEIVIIQYSILFWGNPVYAVSAVVATLLCGMGAGSLTSQRFARPRQALGWVTALLVAILLLYALLLPYGVHAALALSVPIKIALALSLYLMPAFFMGMAFPLGLRILSGLAPSQIPWAWGVNGCLSVCAAAAASLLAIYAGFSVLLALAAVCYLAAGFALWRLLPAQ